MTCEWEAWGEWTTTCGSASRTRKSKTTERVVQKLNCDGLQTSCPAPETEQRVTNCKLPGRNKETLLVGGVGVGIIE